MRICFSQLLLVLAAMAGIVDRVAVVVGGTVITESEVLDDLRLTEFLNNQPLDLSPAQRRAAAERLVDQQLIRKEMEIGRYAAPSATEADAMLRSLRQQRFSSDAEFRAALERYGITGNQLQRHLLWQLTVMRFTDSRFRSVTPEEPEPSANRADPNASASVAGADVDQQLNAWLKEARGGTKIVFKEEAFQ